MLFHVLIKSKHATAKAPADQAAIIYVNTSATAFICCNKNLQEGVP